MAPPTAKDLSAMRSPWPRRLLLPASVALVALVPVATVLGAAIGPVEVAASGTRADAVLMVVYLLAALVLSFLCSIAEATLLSITPSFIEGQRGERPRLAEALKVVRLDKLDQSLAAILTLNTIAHTAGAIGAGAKATLVFGSAWVGLFSAVATLLILFFSEIVPKTLGALHWRTLARPVALFIRVMVIGLYPLIKVSEYLTRAISGGKEVHVFSRDEFVAMAGIGAESGHIDARESRILVNLFRMSSLKTRDVMTPRVVVAGLRENASVTEALAGVANGPFSRLPVYSRDIDHVTGFVLKADLLLASARGEGDQPVHSHRRDLLTVPASMPLSTLLESLLDRRQQIALVVGEYGDTEGLVTLEDAVETLLGNEIVDESDQVSDMRKLARQRWQKRNADKAPGGAP